MMQEGVFAEYEKLVKSIEAYPSKAVQAMLKSLLTTISVCKEQE